MTDADPLGALAGIVEALREVDERAFVDADRAELRHATRILEDVVWRVAEREAEAVALADDE